MEELMGVLPSEAMRALIYQLGEPITGHKQAKRTCTRL